MRKRIHYSGVIDNLENRKLVVLGKDELGRKVMLFNKKYILLIVLLLLTGCSVMQDKMEAMEAEQINNTLCCAPDPDFPHSCDGWKLCEL